MESPALRGKGAGKRVSTHTGAQRDQTGTTSELAGQELRASPGDQAVPFPEELCLRT